MRDRLFSLFLLAITGCSSLKEAGPSATDPGTDGGPTSEPPGTESTGTGGPGSDASVTPGGWDVVTAISDRSQLGASTAAGFRAWRGGVALRGNQVYWVGRGASPGLYTATLPCAGASCVSKIEAVTKPSAFSASASYLYYANGTQIRRYSLAAGTSEGVASDSTEIANLAADDSGACWTSGDDSAMRRSPPGGPATTLITSNGTPVAMAIAGGSLFWEGVDISGNNGLLQKVQVAGGGAKGIKSFSGAFGAVGGNDLYMFWSFGSELHRRTLQTDEDETVAKDAPGVNEIAVDGDAAYWIEVGDEPKYANGRVRRLAHNSTTPETIAVSIPLPIAIAVDNGRVAVLSAGSKDSKYADGKILLVTQRSK